MNSPTLYYVTDPLCIWCYGFTPQLTKLRATLQPGITFITINGGLFPAEKARKADYAFRHYLKGAVNRVTTMTGKQFTDKFWIRLASENFYYDTEPASLAMYVVGHLKSDRYANHYMEHLQKKFFVDGIDPTSKEHLARVGQDIGIEKKEFLKCYDDECFLELTRKQYKFAKSLGIQSYPSLVLVNNNNAYSVSSGYAKFEDIQNNLNWAMSQEKQPQN